MDTVNILAQKVVGHVCRVEISPQMVTTLNSHGRANGYFHNTLRITQHKSPASAGLFYIDADALYAFKSRGFGGEIGVNS